MFCEEGIREMTPMEMRHSEIVMEGLTEEMFSPQIPNDAELWKKLAFLPTPPYSPENYFGPVSCKRSLIQAIVPQRCNTLQVVPDDPPEDLFSDIQPLVLSDEEMVRLTASSSTLINDCMWTGEEFDHHESQRLHTTDRATTMANCLPERKPEISLPPMIEGNVRDLSHYAVPIASPENQICQRPQPAQASQHHDQRWLNFPGRLVIFNKVLRLAERL